LQKDSLEGLTVAIQGVGHVGYHLARDLHAVGVHLTVCDKDQELAQRCADEFCATVVAPEDIYAVKADVFAPCALGAVLNDQTIPLINAPIVAGAANNQLAEPRHAQMLHDHNILYTPDYVINAGGVIHAYSEYQQTSLHEAEARIFQIYNTLLELFERAKYEKKLTSEVADIIAVERLK
jgi:leucine dehydrogenase